MLRQLFLAATALTQAIAGLIELRGLPTSALIPRAAGDISQFIAIGESYATGVGAGVPDRSVFRTRCLRYDQAYPRVLSRDGEISGPADETRLIDNACSGQTIPRILETQFSDTDSTNFEAFGKPQFATISAAGDDIEFKDLVLNCIYEYPQKKRPCQEQIARSKGILNSDEFALSIQNLLQTTFDKGLKNHEDFRIYYLGYAQFFNTEETKPDFCALKTWSLCKFWQTNCERLVLDVPLRTQLNELAKDLNKKIQEAVDSFKDTNKDGNGQPLAKFVDIDEIIQGHRYCENGKQEPVKNDDDIWFFQWLDDETKEDEPKHDFYNQVANQFSNTPNIETLQSLQAEGKLTISAQDFLEAEVAVTNANQTAKDSIDAEGAITNRVKTFHPKIQFHALIRDKLKELIKADFPTDLIVTPTTCDFSAGSCDEFGKTCTEGSEGACVVDRSTGGGQCQCLESVLLPP